MPVVVKTVSFYCAGIAAFALAVPVADLPAMQSAIASGSWWSPSNAPGDHIDLSAVVRYTVAG